MARNNGAAADLSLNAEGGDVGIGFGPFNAALHVARLGDVTLNGPALLQVGQTQSGNLAFDGNELLARNNGAAADLALNAPGGNVGIGVAPFAATLHVTRGGNVSQSQNGFARFGTTGSFNLNLDSNEVQVLNNGVPSQLFLNFRGGGVFVGDVDATTASVVLSVNGNVAKPGGGFWGALSDARAKKDIKPLQGTLDRILSLHGYTFAYTDDAIAQGGALQGEQIGLMAQEVQKVFPEWVYEDDKGRLNVSERGITALMVESLRDLREEKDEADAQLREALRAAEQRVRVLEDENEALRARLDRIEEMLVPR
jgi:polyhydroxyalkanoate synthesis regulator phasin